MAYQQVSLSRFFKQFYTRAKWPLVACRGGQSVFISFLTAMIMLATPWSLLATPWSLPATRGAEEPVAQNDEQMDLSTEEIMELSGVLSQITNLSGEIVLTITSPSGDQRVIRLIAYQKKRSSEREDRLFVFTFPPKVRGTILLVHSRTNQGEDSMWLYLPERGRIKRVDLNSSGHDNFMGSDFTFQDLVSRDLTEYVYILLEDNSNEEHFVVEVRGRTPELQNKFGYSREEHYIRKEDFATERVLFYDLDGNLLKELTVLDWYREEGYANPSQERAYPLRVRMYNHQTGHTSEIVFEWLSFTNEIPDWYFTHRYLRQ